MYACRTGVCVECDAGMCKSFFHVTCAQEQVEVLIQFIHQSIDYLKFTLSNERCLSYILNNTQ